MITKYNLNFPTFQVVPINIFIVAFIHSIVNSYVKISLLTQPFLYGYPYNANI